MAIAPNERKLETRSRLSLRARQEREPEDQQKVSDDGAGERSAHDLGEAVVDGDQGDDQLGRVPERRVQEAADARARVLRGVLGGLSDQPGKGDERRRREHELGRRAEVGRVVEDDRQRPEQQADEEGATNHEREP